MDSGIGCVVLAAGSSERLGQPKALLRVGDGNLVSWLARRLLKQELEPVIVTNEQLFDDILES
ncbi:MAG: NTP transferase domain-containing protein, partial [Candidatus Thermoplasmatota archaeon]|nr:NTP transferase domain-containing protein [Candidatus Thermoplasmatota archaeon]